MKKKTSFILSILSLAFLVACDPSRLGVSGKTNSSKEVRYCYFDGGGSFGKSGIRARQNIGSGPKMRIAQWQSMGFIEKHEKKINIANSQTSIEARISWRLIVTPNALESSFESLELQVPGIKQDDIARAAKWRITNFDGDISDFPISEKQNGLKQIFSADAKGILIPGLLGESLGGINGGSFEVDLLDNSSQSIVRRKFSPPKSWEFKKNSRLAIEGLDALLLTPEKCTASDDAKS